MIRDLPDLQRVFHRLPDILRARIFAIACGNCLRHRDKCCCGRARPPSGLEVVGHLHRLVRRIRRHWPTTKVALRGDAHYGRPGVTSSALPTFDQVAVKETKREATLSLKSNALLNGGG